MIIYSVEIRIDKDVEADWIGWMEQTHIPEVMATDCFLGYQCIKMVGQQTGDTFYIFKYTCENQATLDRYFAEFAPALQADHRQRYEGKFTATRRVV